ncbi:MAG: hypothetical protein ABIP48_04670, partial [Planctomycetota bacterium]
MLSEYRNTVCSIIVRLNGDCLPLPDFWKPEKDAQRVCAAVCATGMSPEYWAKLSEPERIPWLERTLAVLAENDVGEEQPIPEGCP